MCIMFYTNPTCGCLPSLADPDVIHCDESNWREAFDMFNIACDGDDMKQLLVNTHEPCYWCSHLRKYRETRADIPLREQVLCKGFEAALEVMLAKHKEWAYTERIKQAKEDEFKRLLEWEARRQEEENACLAEAEHNKDDKAKASETSSSSYENETDEAGPSTAAPSLPGQPAGSASAAGPSSSDGRIVYNIDDIHEWVFIINK